MGEKVNEVILPGDIILKIEKDAKGKENYKLGPGLRQESGNIISLKAGILRKKEPNILWIDNNQRKVGINLDNMIIYACPVCMYVKLCMAMWLCICGYVYVAMYMWLCISGYDCMAVCVWLCMYGYVMYAWLCYVYMAMYVWLCMLSQYL